MSDHHHGGPAIIIYNGPATVVYFHITLDGEPVDHQSTNVTRTNHFAGADLDIGHDYASGRTQLLLTAHYRSSRPIADNAAGISAPAGEPGPGGDDSPTA